MLKAAEKKQHNYIYIKMNIFENISLNTIDRSKKFNTKFEFDIGSIPTYKTCTCKIYNAFSLLLAF